MIVKEKTLLRWEKELDDINSNCYVSKELLSKTFSKSTLNAVVNNKLSNKDNISYHTAKLPVSIRYINDALVWANVIKHINFKGQKICELCPGNSIVLDLALCYLDFKNTVTKIDYSNWVDNEKGLIDRRFNVISKSIDVIREIQSIPQSDLILLNHGIDDLFIGLWATKYGVDYFGRAMSNYEENDTCWNNAIRNNTEHVKVLKDFVKNLASRVNKNGFIIIKIYPSGFETHYRQIKRINFTAKLTKILVNELKKYDLKQVNINLNQIEGPSGSKFNESFFILKNI